MQLVHFSKFMKSVLMFDWKKGTRKCSSFLEDMFQNSLMSTVKILLETFPFGTVSFGEGQGGGSGGKEGY